jgi:hypothetical protein
MEKEHQGHPRGVLRPLKLNRRGRPKKTDEKAKPKLKPKKEKKLKIYFGREEIVPEGYRRASMLEALEKNKISYYGVKKIDTKLLNMNFDKKKNEILKKELILKSAQLRGKLNNFKRQIDYLKGKDEKERTKYINEFNKYKKELITVLEKIKTLDKLLEKKND